MTTRPNPVPRTAAEAGIHMPFVFSAQRVDYPEAMVLVATVLSRDGAVAGLEVSAQVTDPAGSVFNVRLRDGGQGADGIADDGIYAASIHYTLSGPYAAVATATDPAGAARTSYAGVLGSLTADGTPQAPAGRPIDFPFTLKSATATTTAWDVRPDDHADSHLSGACTAVAPDNIDVPGRIDAAGDVDCFRLAAAEPPLVVRATSLNAGMKPVLTVYDSKGGLIRELSLPAGGGGLAWEVPPHRLDPAGLLVSVRHADSGAGTGGYAFSAGPPLTSDPGMSVAADSAAVALALVALCAVRRRSRYSARRPRP